MRFSSRAASRFASSSCLNRIARARPSSSTQTRGGSEGGDVQVYDPRTGKPLKFVYEPVPNNAENHQIRATLPMPVPEGGVGRVLIYKTYKDERTYRMEGQDIAWVRSLSGYRLGVVLPKGFAFISSNVAAQLSTTTDGQLKIAFANPSGQSNPVTVRARKTTAVFTPSKFDDMFFDDIKTLYDLDANGAVKVEQTYSDYRKGGSATLDSLGYLPLDDLKVIDLDTAKAFTPVKAGKTTTVKLEVPITDDKQSAHLKITGTIKDGYKVVNDELVFERTLHGLRNTILLPAGWEVSACSQSGTIGMYQNRAFVALINLNSENEYKVTVRAHKSRRTVTTVLRLDVAVRVVVDRVERIRGRSAFNPDRVRHGIVQDSSNPEVRIPLRSDEPQLLVVNLNDVGNQPGEGHHRVARIPLVVTIRLLPVEVHQRHGDRLSAGVAKGPEDEVVLVGLELRRGVDDGSVLADRHPDDVRVRRACGVQLFLFRHAISNAQPPVRAPSDIHPW